MKIVISILIGASLAFAELKVGDPAPTFFVRDLTDKSFFLSDTLKLGKPIVLSFFATHCIPCRAEMPQLDTLSREYTNVNFYLVDVSGKIKEDPVKVKELVTKLGVNALPPQTGPVLELVL